MFYRLHVFTMRLRVMQRKVYCCRNSVRPSVRRVYCDKTKWCTADSLIPHETAITLVFWHQHSMPPSLSNIRRNWPTPSKNGDFRRVSAHNVSTIRDSEKSSITTNTKSTTSFPTSYRRSAYVTPKSPKVWLETDFSVFRDEIQFQSNKVSLCENFHR